MAETAAERRTAAGVAMSDCLFEQHWFTFGMLFFVGLPIGIRKKNYWPVVTAGMLGTLGDFAYGYKSKCADQVAAYKLACKSSQPKFGGL